MTTSGSIDFALTRDNISTHILRLLGIITKGETADSNDLSFCSNALNMMVKSWQTDGIHLWAQSQALIPLISGRNEYIIDGTTTNQVGGDKAHNTTLSAAASAGASSITVTSATWANVSDYVVIELDDETIQTTTISSISTTTLTLAATVTSAAASGNNVIIFTSLLNRPIEINSAQYRYRDGTERTLSILSRSKFMALPNKGATGSPTAMYYTPQLSNGRLYVWPTPENASDMLSIAYQRTLEDFDAAGNNPDLPQEWLDALVYNGAVRVAPAFGISLNKVSPEIIQIAVQTRENLKAWDFESGAVQITPNYRHNG